MNSNSKFNPARLLNETMNHFECPICLQQYDQAEKYPMVVCPQLHSTCYRCCLTYIFKGVQKGKCPECLVDVYYHKDLHRFRHLNQIRKISQQLKRYGSNIRKQVNDMVQKNTNMHNIIEEQKSKIQWLVKQIQQKQSKTQQLIGEIGQKDVMIDKLKKKIEELENQNSKLTNTIENIRNNINQINPNVNANDIQNKNQINQINYNKYPNYNNIEMQNANLYQNIINPYIENNQNLHHLYLHQNPSLQNPKKQNPPTTNSTEHSLVSRNNGPVKVSEWIDSNCLCYNRLNIDRNNIVSKTPGYFFSCERAIGRYVLTAVFNKIGPNHVSLGIVDTLYKNKQSLMGVSHLIYYRSDSTLHLGQQPEKKVGKGYILGEAITLIVDTEEGTVQWRVGSNVRFRVLNSMVKDVNIQWVPYLGLSNQGDSVSIFR